MTEAGKGILAMVAASGVWGLSPIYYKLLADVPPLEVLSHRTLWSLLFFGIVLAAQGHLRDVPRVVRAQAGSVALAAVMISANWFVFILSVQMGMAVESSLGYFIFPLVAVSIGVAAFGERLSRLQGLAVALAAVAVGLLTFGLGVAPWIALTLACTFGVYGLIKKRIAEGPVVTVTAEVLILAPLALVWLLGLHGGLWTEMGRRGAWFGCGRARLAFARGVGRAHRGAADPLLLRRAQDRDGDAGPRAVPQPDAQFFCAVVLFGEPFTRWHMAAFALIWAGLAIFSADSLRRQRNRIQASASSSRVPSDATSAAVSK